MLWITCIYLYLHYLPVFTCIYLHSPVFTCIYMYLPEFTCIYLYLHVFTCIYLYSEERVAFISRVGISETL